MRKYRIVSRPSYSDRDYTWYHAQYKFLNLFWRDCDYDAFTPGSPSSLEIENVETFIESKIHKRTLDLSQKVIRTYE